MKEPPYVRGNDPPAKFVTELQRRQLDLDKREEEKFYAVLKQHGNKAQAKT